MEKYRNTYALVNLKNLRKNIKTLIEYAKGYEYYFGIVKANSYGHAGKESVEAFLDSGCNFLGTATLEEAIEIREYGFDTPILCIEPVKTEFLNVCVKNNVSITVSSFEYLESLIKTGIKNLKIHIKLDTGMNRLGFKEKEKFIKALDLIKENDLYLEGIFTHIYSADNEDKTKNQIKRFEDMIFSIDYKNVPIIHIANSETLYNYPKLKYANGCRMGMGVYGLLPTDKLPVETTITFHTEVIEIRNVKKGEDVGYSAKYVAEEDCKIATLPVGYVDGMVRANKGRNVYINDKPYEIVGNICMDMMMIKVDDSVSVKDKVDLIKDRFHLYEIVEHNNSCTEEVVCLISYRVPRLYVE